MFTTGKFWSKDGLLDRDGLWDRVAVIVSGLCVVHCIGTLIFVALVSSAAGMFLNPLIHEIGLGIAIALGIFTLGRSFFERGYVIPAAIGGLGLAIMIGAIAIGHENNHGISEIVLTILGVGLLAFAHKLNYRITR